MRDTPLGAYRWRALGLAVLAQAAFSAILVGLTALGPVLRAEYQLSLSTFGAILATIMAGQTVALIPWGLLADKIGERRGLAMGLGGAALALMVATVGGFQILVMMLFLSGLLGAVAIVAGGRVVMAWFEFGGRGTAFGLRQAAVPLGGVAAALMLPPLAQSLGARAGLVGLGIGCLIAAGSCLVWLRDAPAGNRDSSTSSPIRDGRLYRLAAASALLVTAQAAVVGFVPLFLYESRAMSAVGAGAVLASIQGVGIVMRIVGGRLSDRIHSRLFPLRWTAMGIAAAWTITPFAFNLPLVILVSAVVLTGSLSLSWNGFSFSAAAEYGKHARAGTAIALQQTALSATWVLFAPVFGWLVAATSWRIAYTIIALGPAAAWYVLRPLILEERAAMRKGGDSLPPLLSG